MLLNNNRKIANEAMFKADPQAVVPRQTLNSLLNSAKAKINAVTSGDLGTEYDIYQRPSQDSDTSSLTTNSNRELLQHIADNRTCEPNLGEDLGTYIVRKAKEEEEFMKLKDCFTVNLDESRFMGSEGVLRVIGSATRKKHEKNTSDSRQSITIVRVGSAAGVVEGPHIFLAKGVELTTESMLKKNFARIHKAPIGSFVEMTPNAYMTNEVWMKIVPHLCDGIRAMEGITNHPDWWIVLSLDGFGHHLVGKSLKEFFIRKILVIKEEGDTSQVSQAYDQLVTKSDKKFT